MEGRTPRGPAKLTDRQREVARLVADGLTNPEIAERLGITLDGAKYHVSELLARLGLERREDIAAWHRERARARRRRALLVVAATLTAGGVAVAAVLLVAAARTGAGTVIAGVKRTAAAGAPVTPVASPSPPAGGESAYRALPYGVPPPGSPATPVENRIPPPTLAVAEAEAPVFRQGDAFAEPPPSSFGGVARETRCVDVGGGGGGGAGASGGAAWSYDWMLHATQSVAGGAPVWDLDLAPAHVASVTAREHAPDLIIRGRMDATGATHVYESYFGQPAPDSSGTLAFHARLAFPAAGPWRLVVTAGANWGCFTLPAATRAAPASVLLPLDSVAAAEREGTRLPRAPGAALAAAALLDPYRRVASPAYRSGGTTDRRCVDATGLAYVLSGDFLFVKTLLESSWNPTGGSKVFWGPAEQGGLGAVLVRATLLGDPRHTYVYSESQPTARAENVDGSPGPWTYLSSWVPPLPGTWLVIATAGENWGCWTLELGGGS